MWIIFLEVKPSFDFFFKTAKSLGLKVYYISSNISNINSIDVSLVDEKTFIKNINYTSIKKTICEFGKAKFLALWCIQDKLMPLATRINIEILKNSNTYSYDLSIITKNKYLLRNKLNNSKYNIEHKLIDIENLPSTNTVKFPCIIKPILGYSSIGVEKIVNKENYIAAIKRTESTLATIAKSVKGLPLNQLKDCKKHILLEEYIEGEEYSIEVFANKMGVYCLGICQKTKMAPPYFEEISYMMPAKISKRLYSILSKAGIEILKILGLKSGIAHLEVIYKNGEIYVLDVGLRLGGSGLTHYIIHNAFGINIIKLIFIELCNLHSHFYSNIEKTQNNISLLFLYQIGKGGIVKSLPRPVNIFPDAEIILFELYTKKNDILKGYPNYSFLPGFILFKIMVKRTKSYLICDKIIQYHLKKNKIKYK